MAKNFFKNCILKQTLKLFKHLTFTKKKRNAKLLTSKKKKKRKPIQH